MAISKTKRKTSAAPSKVTVLSHAEGARLYLTLRGICGDENDGFTSDQVAAVLDRANGANITVRLNSGAGRIREALAIHDLLTIYAGNGPGTVHCSLEGVVAGPSVAVAFAASHWHVDSGVWLGLCEPTVTGTVGASKIMSAALELDFMTNRLAGMIFNSFDGKGRKGLSSVQNVRDILAAERWVQGPARMMAYSGVSMTLVRDSSTPPIAPTPAPFAALYRHAPDELRRLHTDNRVPGWAARL
jgi:hypothetical protein